MNHSVQYYHEFYKNNRIWIFSHVFVTLIIFPLELILFSIFSKKMFNAMQNKSSQTNLFSVLIIFFIILLIIQSIYVLKDILDSKIIPEFENFMRSKLMIRVLDSPREDQDIHVGELIHNISRLPTTMHHNYENILKCIIPFVFGCICFTGYVFYLQWRLGLLCLIFFTVFFVLSFIWFFKIQQISILRIKNENMLMEKYEDVLINQENIHLANQNKTEMESIKALNSQFQKYKFKEIKSINIFKIVSIVSICIFLFSLFIYSYFLHKKYPFIIPMWKFIAFTTIIILMTRNVIGILSQTSKMIYHYGSGYNLENFLNSNAGQLFSVPNSSLQKIKCCNYDITIQHLSFSYQDNVILKDINLSIPYMSSCLIVGSIGSGKSTLALILTGMKYNHYQGIYRIGPYEIKDCDPYELRNVITYMNQKNILFDRSIIQNIWYGENIPENPYAQLKELECPETILNRLEENAGKYGSNFSGGQKRLIFLFRCYFSKCPIVILDEPTSNIDPDTTHIVIKLIKKLQSKKTVICISHDPSLNRHFQKIFRLSKGILHPIQ